MTVLVVGLVVRTTHAGEAGERGSFFCLGVVIRITRSGFEREGLKVLGVVGKMMMMWSRCGDVVDYLA